MIDKRSFIEDLGDFGESVYDSITSGTSSLYNNISEGVSDEFYKTIKDKLKERDNLKVKLEKLIVEHAKAKLTDPKEAKRILKDKEATKKALEALGKYTVGPGSKGVLGSMAKKRLGANVLAATALGVGVVGAGLLAKKLYDNMNKPDKYNLHRGPGGHYPQYYMPITVNPPKKDVRDKSNGDNLYSK